MGLTLDVYVLDADGLPLKPPPHLRVPYEPLEWAWGLRRREFHGPLCRAFFRPLEGPLERWRCPTCHGCQLAWPHEDGPWGHDGDPQPWAWAWLEELRAWRSDEPWPCYPHEVDAPAPAEWLALLDAAEAAGGAWIAWTWSW